VFYTKKEKFLRRYGGHLVTIKSF